MVNSINNICKIEGFMTISSLLQGIKILKKRKMEQNEGLSQVNINYIINI